MSRSLKISKNKFYGRVYRLWGMRRQFLWLANATEWTKIRINFIGWRNVRIFQYNLHYMIIWTTKSIVPHVDTVIYKGQIDKIWFMDISFNRAKQRARCGWIAERFRGQLQLNNCEVGDYWMSKVHQHLQLLEEEHYSSLGFDKTFVGMKLKKKTELSLANWLTLNKFVVIEGTCNTLF